MPELTRICMEEESCFLSVNRRLTGCGISLLVEPLRGGHQELKTGATTTDITKTLILRYYCGCIYNSKHVTPAANSDIVIGWCPEKYTACVVPNEQSTRHD
jgi:hypothetical protein